MTTIQKTRNVGSNPTPLSTAKPASLLTGRNSGRQHGVHNEGTSPCSAIYASSGLLVLTPLTAHVRLHAHLPLGTSMFKAQPTCFLPESILRPAQVVDLRRWCHGCGLGVGLHFHVHLPLLPDQATVDDRARRPLHGPDRSLEGYHHVQCRDRSLHLRVADPHGFEAPDAKNREGRRHLLLCPRPSVRVFPSVLVSRALINSRRCCVIGCVRFWQVSVVDLVGNLTGTSLTTFMLCTVELMLAGLCINIPMLRPFYLRCRAKYKSSQLSNTGGGQSALSQPQTGPQVPSQPNHGDYTAWIELVSLSCCPAFFSFP